MDRDERKRDEGDPTIELGQKLSPSERVRAVLNEIEGVAAQYGITSWEKNFLEGNKNSIWPRFTPKQEEAMERIEFKVFGTEEDRKDTDVDELTGELKFRGNKK